MGEYFLSQQPLDLSLCIQPARRDRFRKLLKDRAARRRIFGAQPPKDFAAKTEGFDHRRADRIRRIRLVAHHGRPSEYVAWMQMSQSDSWSVVRLVSNGHIALHEQIHIGSFCPLPADVSPCRQRNAFEKSREQIVLLWSQAVKEWIINHV